VIFTQAYTFSHNSNSSRSKVYRSGLSRSRTGSGYWYI